MSGEHRLVDIILDEASLSVASADVEHERRVAIFDLLEANQFEVIDLDAGPYALRLAIADSRLVLAITTADGAEARTIVLSLTSLRKVIKDYFLICESYHSAIRSATPTQIEAIDMGRRSLHDEGGELIAQRLSGKVKMDRETARRLFTLICALRARN